MVIETKLNSADVRKAADEVRQFGRDFQTKVHQVLQRLAEKGITTAQTTIGNFGKFVTFSKQTAGDGVVVVAQETNVIVARWLRKGEEVEAVVSPLLMAEFGAGSHAVIWEGLTSDTNVLPDGRKIGRGTFPEQTHAFESYWHYMDLSGNWQTVSGLKPTRPLHNAVLEIIAQIESTAREVFGNGSD